MKFGSLHERPLTAACNLMEAIRNLASLESAAEHSRQNQNKRGLVHSDVVWSRQRPAERERKCRATLEVCCAANVWLSGELERAGRTNVSWNYSGYKPKSREPPSVAGTLLPCCVSKGTTISEGPETNNRILFSFTFSQVRAKLSHFRIFDSRFQVFLPSALLTLHPMNMCCKSKGLGSVSPGVPGEK